MTIQPKKKKRSALSSIRDEGTLMLDIFQRVCVVETQNSQILTEQARLIGEHTADRADAQEAREKIYSRLSGLEHGAAAAKKMEPIVADYEKLRQNINGGLVVVVGIGAVLFTTVGYFAKEVWTYIWLHMPVPR